jgi:hypothetical protein
MKSQGRVVFITGMMCFVIGLSFAWLGRVVANASVLQAAKTTTTQTPLQAAASTDTTPSLSEKNDQHVKIADRTKSYLVDVTTKNALKVDGSAVTQPVSIVNTNGVNGDLPENTVSPDLGYPRTLTMCWNADSVSVQESIDGKTWFPSLTTQAGKTVGIIAVGIGCQSVPPARFVKWTSQDFQFPKADGMFQASY